MKYQVRVRQWVMFETTVVVEAGRERDAREMALSEGRPKLEGARGVITKNQTTILTVDGQELPR